jgi:hypothetical protein
MGAQQGASSVYLEVRLSNITAIKLYEKLGFREIGRRSNYYPDSKEDALVMIKNIAINLPDTKVQKKNWSIKSKSAATSRGGLGPYQGPSSYPQLCWWPLIGSVLDFLSIKRVSC